MTDHPTLSDTLNDTESREKYEKLSLQVLLSNLAQAAQTLGLVAAQQADPAVKHHLTTLSGACLNAYELLKPAEATDDPAQQ